MQAQLCCICYQTAKYQSLEAVIDCLLLRESSVLDEKSLLLTWYAEHTVHCSDTTGTAGAVDGKTSAGTR